MTVDRTKPCRENVRTVLGTALAKNATEKFCTAFAQPPLGTPIADDGFPRLMRVVVELTPQKLPTGWFNRAVETMRAYPGWNAVLVSLRTALGELDESLLREDPLLTPAETLREVCVREMRQRCYRLAAPVQDELDRAAARSIGPEAVFAGRLSEPLVQYCWINQTFLVWANPRELAELAADRGISRIDVPRTLALQIKETSKVVGAVQHRQKTGHTGKGVKVAVIDSEVACLKTVFQDRLIHRIDYTGEGWGFPGEHGTMVAGIIAANEDGVQGIAPDAVIYNYKVIATKDVADPLDVHAELALKQALEDGVHIANCSWKTGAFPNGESREALAVNFVSECGMTVVAAMGNEGECGVQSLTCPADAEGAIAVGATGLDGTSVQLYSGQGPSYGSKACPDVVAPGGNNNEPIQCFRVDGTFGDGGWGTSVAAPHVSGILALLLQGDPGLSPGELRQQLTRICKQLEVGPFSMQGHGIPDLTKLP